jgi:hypothetical protein
VVWLHALRYGHNAQPWYDFGSNCLVCIGGTNWGNLANPGVYTSYDYGSAIRESRVLSPKYHEMKLQGLFYQASPTLLTTSILASGSGTAFADTNAVFVTNLGTPGSTSNYYVVRQSTNKYVDHSLLRRGCHLMSSTVRQHQLPSSSRSRRLLEHCLSRSTAARSRLMAVRARFSSLSTPSERAQSSTRLLRCAINIIDKNVWFSHVLATGTNTGNH